MSVDRENWITPRAALDRLGHLHWDEARDTLIAWAETEQVRTQARLAILYPFFGDESERRLTDKPVPSGLWSLPYFRALAFWNTGNIKIEINSRRRRLFDVKFNASDLTALLPSLSTSEVEANTAKIVEWADGAVTRKISLNGARGDAAKLFSAPVPTVEECKSALKAARRRAGVPTKLGRPVGAKSFQNNVPAK